MAIDPVVLDFYGDVAGFIRELKTAGASTLELAGGFENLKQVAANVAFNYTIMSAANLAAELSNLMNVTTALADAFGLDTDFFNFSKATATAAEFDQTMRQIAATSDADSAALAMLRSEAIRLGEETPFSSNQSANALLNFAKAGYDAKSMLQSLAPTLTLASAGELGIAEAADIATGVMSGMGIGTDRLGQVVDVLAAAANGSKADVREMGKSFEYVASTASMAGKDLIETSSALMILADANMKADKGGTALDAVLREMANPARRARDLMEDLGLTFTDVGGNIRPIADVVDDLKTKLDGLGSGDRSRNLNILFGDQGARGMSAMMQQGGDAIRKYQDELLRAEGTAQKIADSNMGGIKGAIERASGAIDTFRQNLGEALVPIITDVANGIAWMAEHYSMLANAIKPAVQWVSDSVKGMSDFFASLGETSAGMYTFGEVVFMASVALSVFFSMVAQVMFLRSMYNLIMLILPTLVAWATGIKGVTVAQAILMAISGNWVLLAAGIAAAGVAVYGIHYAFSKAAEEAGGMAKVTEEAKGSIAELKKTAAGPIAVELSVNDKEAMKRIDDLKKAIEDFKQQQFESTYTVGLDNADAQAMRLRLQGASGADVEEGLRFAREAEAMKEQLTLGDDVDSFTSKLQEQFETFGMGADEIELYRLQLRGATDDQLKAARAFMVHVKAMNEEKKAREDLQKRAEQVKDDIKSPFQKFEDEARNLFELFQTGAIDALTYQKGTDKLKKDFGIDDASNKKAIPQISGIEEFSKRIQQIALKGPDDKEKERLELQRQGNELLQDIDKTLKDQGKVGFAIV